MKLRVDFMAPESVTIELTELQENRWEAYQEARSNLDRLDWYTQRDEYMAASDKVDEEFDALVYSLNLEVEEPEDLVDDVSPSRW